MTLFLQSLLQVLRETDLEEPEAPSGAAEAQNSEAPGPSAPPVPRGVFAECETSGNHSFWFDRVLSVSNPADAPPRQKFDSLDPAHRIRLDLEKFVDNACIRRSEPLM